MAYISLGLGVLPQVCVNLAFTPFHRFQRDTVENSKLLLSHMQSLRQLHDLTFPFDKDALFPASSEFCLSCC